MVKKTTNVATATEVASKKHVCTKCGNDKEKDFYVSSSELNSLTGKMSICKPCMGELYNKYLQIYKNEQQAIYYMCRKLDICYHEASFNGAMTEVTKGKTTEFWQIYMTKLNSFGKKNGAGLCFDESDRLDEERNAEIVNQNSDLDKDLKIRWGKGFNSDELQFLEQTYHEWLTHHDCEQLSVQKLVRMICMKELDIRIARENGSPTDKLEKSLMELMNSSNLTPKTMGAINETDSAKIYGVWLKEIEQTRPAEYFQDKQLYYDHDGIFDYFNRFILRPMKNLLTNSRDFDKEFMIENEMEEGNQDEE